MSAKQYRMAVAVAWAVAILFVSASVQSQSVSSTKLPKNAGKNDYNLDRSIRHQLQELPFYSVFDIISFTVDGEKVTLTGQVQRTTLKDHAEGAVKSLEGVSTVINNIEVLPHSSTDHELRRNVYRTIFEDPTLQKYAIQALPSIHIIVKNGVVSLEGSVDSEADRALAGNLVSNVPKVGSLGNNLVVRKRDPSSK